MFDIRPVYRNDITKAPVKPGLTNWFIFPVNHYRHLHLMSTYPKKIHIVIVYHDKTNIYLSLAPVTIFKCNTWLENGGYTTSSPTYNLKRTLKGRLQLHKTSSNFLFNSSKPNQVIKYRNDARVPV